MSEKEFEAKIRGKRIGGIIEAWQIREPSGNEIVVGYIFEDDYWDDGVQFSTSRIESISDKKDYVVTKNSYYRLGTPREAHTDQEWLDKFRLTNERS